MGLEMLRGRELAGANQLAVEGINEKGAQRFDQIRRQCRMARGPHMQHTVVGIDVTPFIGPGPSSIETILTRCRWVLRCCPTTRQMKRSEAR